MPPRLNLDIASTAFSINLAIPCGLILNELISNVFKHAFPDGRMGAIAVSLKPISGKEFVLSVKDDGVGLPDGFELAQTKSLGLPLVQAFAVQIAGRLTVESHPGTAWSVRFPNFES